MITEQEEVLNSIETRCDLRVFVRIKPGAVALQNGIEVLCVWCKNSISCDATFCKDCKHSQYPFAYVEPIAKVLALFVASASALWGAWTFYTDKFSEKYARISVRSVTCDQNLLYFSAINEGNAAGYISHLQFTQDIPKDPAIRRFRTLEGNKTSIVIGPVQPADVSFKFQDEDMDSSSTVAAPLDYTYIFRYCNSIDKCDYDSPHATTFQEKIKCTQ